MPYSKPGFNAYANNEIPARQALAEFAAQESVRNRTVYCTDLDKILAREKEIRPSHQCICLKPGI